MPSEIYRNTYAKIDFNAIKHNLEVIQFNLGEEKKIIPVLKANAYGHGSVEVAKYLESEHYNFFAVALLEEAMELRKSGVKATILVLGWVAPRYAYLAAEHGFILTVFQTEWLDELRALNLEMKINIHIKLDTGMGRNGLQTKYEVKNFLKELKNTELVKVSGIYTHFASADQNDHTYYNGQLIRFNELTSIVEKEIPTKDLTIHIGNSGASIQHSKDMTAYSRVGVSIYGMYPSPEVKQSTTVKLQPALELRSEIVHVKQALADNKISYASTYTAKEGEWIGTVAIGYADGWLRKLQGSNVLVNGKRMEVIGRICMDMLMIRLDQKYDIGTEVTLIGKDGDAFISVDEIAEQLDTINYEITTNLTKRVPRMY